MASQSRSQRRRQQQRTRAQQRSAAGRPIDTSSSSPKADLTAHSEPTALAEEDAERLVTSAAPGDIGLPVNPVSSQRSQSTGRVVPERDTATSVAPRRQRRAARPAIEPVDYTLDYEIARHDLRRIAFLAALLLGAMVALRFSGILF